MRASWYKASFKNQQFKIIHGRSLAELNTDFFEHRRDVVLLRNTSMRSKFA